MVCPPYDVISPGQREQLYELDAHNYVRLEYGRELPGDSDSGNKFTRAVATLEEWLQNGILEKDRAPAVYVHDHHFTVNDKKFMRRGIIATVRLEEWEKMVVRPHEGTFPRAKSERLSLMWATSAGISPIMTLYQDTNDPDSMVLLEEWKDWESLERHIRSESYRNILELMELSSKQPEIQLNTISSIKGMEHIEKIRLGASPRI